MTRALALCLALLPTAAQADSTQLCLDMGTNSASQCDCATVELNSNITLSERETYNQISTAFLAAKNSEDGVADAWQAAFAQVAAQRNTSAEDLMMNMNSVGQKHEQAIQSCR